MPTHLHRFIALASTMLLLASCSTESDQTSKNAARPSDPTLTFNWSAPARLSVTETIPGLQSTLKIRYDVTVKSHSEEPGQLLLTTGYVTPFEMNGERLDVDRLPANVASRLERQLIDYHSRPQLIVGNNGEIVSVEGLEKSVRTMANINEARNVDDFVTRALGNPFLVKRIESIATSVWDCWVTPWLDFSVPPNDSLEQNISMVILDGAAPAPATRTLTHHGFSDDTDALVHLEQVTRAEGPELAQAMLDLSEKTMRELTGSEGENKEKPDVTGIVTARTEIRQEVKLYPKTMKPVWAKCSRELVVDSKDPEVLPSRSQKKVAEYSFQWY